MRHKGVRVGDNTASHCQKDKLQAMNTYHRPVRATFIVEQHIGHYTYYRNLRRFVDQDPSIAATWVEVTYHQPRGFWERLPALPPSLRGTLRGRSQARCGLKQTQADVYFFNTQVPAALAGRIVRRHPYIIATDLTPLQYDRLAPLYHHKSDAPGLLRAYKQHVNRALFCSADRLLPWSTWARSSLIEDYGVAPAKIEVVPPGVDLSTWTPGAKESPGLLRILFVGGDFERKGGDVLLRAFRMLPPGTAELSLVTRTQIPGTEDIHVYNDMQPNSPELIKLYHNSDVFVLPTEAEAFGIAAVEASACGLPVIATGIGGLPDIVLDGETGFLTIPGDVTGLAERLRLLAGDRDRCQRMGKAARAHAEQAFDARRNANRVVHHLTEVADSPHGKQG